VKKAAQKKREKRIKREGFFQSPFFLGIMNFIPIVVVFLSLWYLGRGFVNMVLFENKVLGIKTEEKEIRVGVKTRIEELKDIAKTVQSEAVIEEITRLESL
jgi:hypothetical protein